MGRGGVVSSSLLAVSEERLSGDLRSTVLAEVQDRYVCEAFSSVLLAEAEATLDIDVSPSLEGNVSFAWKVFPSQLAEVGVSLVAEGSSSMLDSKVMLGKVCPSKLVETEACLVMEVLAEMEACLGMELVVETEACLGMEVLVETEACLGMEVLVETEACLGMELLSSLESKAMLEWKECLPVPDVAGGSLDREVSSSLESEAIFR